MPYPGVEPVRPHVRDAAEKIGKQFSVKQIHGYGLRSRASFHPIGRALDFMVYNDMAKGDAIAAHVIANAKAYGAIEVIWKQRIWTVSAPRWEGMKDRGSPTENHMDHVHVSFSATPGTGAVSNSQGSSSGGNCLPILVGMLSVPAAAIVDYLTR